MGEFDLDLQVGSNGFGWESVFRPGRDDVPGAVRMDTTGPSYPLGCTPQTNTCDFTCGGLTGSPCAC